MIRRTLAIAAVTGLLGAAGASAMPVDHGRAPEQATAKVAYRVAKHAERRDMNSARGLRRRGRFAWRVGRHAPRQGFVCMRRGNAVRGLGVRRSSGTSRRWRTWKMHGNAIQSYGQHCQQILNTRIAQARAR